MPTLRIYVSGLCVLVPKGVTNRGSRNAICEELHILFANAATPERIRQVLRNNELGVHKPLVQFMVPNRVGNSPRYPLFQDHSGGLNGLWLLDRETLEIRGDQGGGVTFQDLPLGNYDTPPDDGNLRDSIQWFSPFKDVTGRLKKAKANLVQREVIDIENCLAARMVIRSGTLSTAGFSFNRRQGQHYFFHISNRNQAIATLARIDLELPDGPVDGRPEVTLTATKFPFEPDGGSQKPPLSLKRVVAGDQRIDICVLNQEFDELVAQELAQDDPDEVLRRLRLEDQFIFPLLESCTGLGPVGFANPNTRNPYVRRQLDGSIHPAWRRWLTPGHPGNGGENGPPGGSCRPVFVADPNS